MNSTLTALPLAAGPHAVAAATGTRKAMAEHLSEIAFAPTIAELWYLGRRYARQLGSRGLCLIDLVMAGESPKVVRATFDPLVEMEDLRQKLAPSGAPVQISDDVLLVPGFGPQGIEIAVAVTLPNGYHEEAEDFAPLMVQGVQIAYGRYRELCPPRTQQENPLSMREREIMLWVKQGKSNGVIADILGISASSVDTYMRRIFRKLEVTDRTSAAVKAMAIGALA